MSDAPVANSTGPARPKDWVEPKNKFACRGCGCKLFWLAIEDGKASHIACPVCLKSVRLRESA